jgi:hypothetical protein
MKEIKYVILYLAPVPTFTVSYGSGSASKKFTVPTVPLLVGLNSEFNQLTNIFFLRISNMYKSVRWVPVTNCSHLRLSSMT